MPPSPGDVADARATGREAVATAKVVLAERLATLLRKDPDLASTAVEVGLIDRQWLDEPGRHPVSTAGALDVVERFLERSTERRPSLVARLGLSTLQALSWRSEEPGEGSTAELTMVFTDLEGFTRYTARAGDEAATHLLADHHRVVGPIVRSRGGRLVKRLGDGLMLSFHEPAAAVHAALELVDEAPGGLRLRAGIHCGDVMVLADDVIGHTVNVAARVAEAARGGQVLATADVVAGAGELRGVKVLRARRRTFKGVDGTIVVHRVERA